MRTANGPNSPGFRPRSFRSRHLAVHIVLTPKSLATEPSRVVGCLSMIETHEVSPHTLLRFRRPKLACMSIPKFSHSRLLPPMMPPSRFSLSKLPPSRRSPSKLTRGFLLRCCLLRVASIEAAQLLPSAIRQLPDKMWEARSGQPNKSLPNVFQRQPLRSNPKI